MSQEHENPKDGMRDEYDFRGGVRGKYAQRLAGGGTVVVLDDDVARLFPDSASVNAALRELARIAERAAEKVDR
jgi:hypothetical protein